MSNENRDRAGWGSGIFGGAIYDSDQAGTYLKKKLVAICENSACRKDPIKNVPRDTIDCPECTHSLFWRRMTPSGLEQLKQKMINKYVPRYEDPSFKDAREL